MNSKEKVRLIEDAADDMQADRIETLDVRAKTSIADYFIVCSGTSDRHIQSIADRVSEKLLMVKEKPLRVEGEKSGWVLQDYGDVVFHVMKEDQRQFYDLETLWSNFRPDPNLAE
jgi:ribosome-associated protein